MVDLALAIRASFLADLPGLPYAPAHLGPPIGGLVFGCRAEVSKLLRAPSMGQEEPARQQADSNP